MSLFGQILWLGPLSIDISLSLFRILFQVLIEFEIARENREIKLEKKKRQLEDSEKGGIEHSENFYCPEVLCHA